jgi:hypothetical protein
MSPYQLNCLTVNCNCDTNKYIPSVSFFLHNCLQFIHQIHKFCNSLHVRQQTTVWVGSIALATQTNLHHKGHCRLKIYIIEIIVCVLCIFLHICIWYSIMCFVPALYLSLYEAGMHVGMHRSTIGCTNART